MCYNIYRSAVQYKQPNARRAYTCLKKGVMKNNPTDSTNPKFDFYSKLNNLLKGNLFNKELAVEIAELSTLLFKTPTDPMAEYGLVRAIVTNLSVDDLEKWHEILSLDSTDWNENIHILRNMVKCEFQDLATQMTNEPVRSLHQSLRKIADIPEGDIFLHLRRCKDLGDGFAAMSVVTDDTTALRKFWENQYNYHKLCGDVHYSESFEAKDPS